MLLFLARLYESTRSYCCHPDVCIGVSVNITLPLSCWTRIYPAFANSVDPDQLASEEANWPGSALFAIKYVNIKQ